MRRRSSGLPSNGCDGQVRAGSSLQRANDSRRAAGTLELAGWFAVAAAAVYVKATIAGSVPDPSYSQVRQHISDLGRDGSFAIGSD